MDKKTNTQRLGELERTVETLQAYVNEHMRPKDKFYLTGDVLTVWSPKKEKETDTSYSEWLDEERINQGGSEPYIPDAIIENRESKRLFDFIKDAFVTALTVDPTCKPR